MVYRKLHQNVGTFRAFLDHWATRYGAGDSFAKEKLASKFIGRWRDGTPVELSPDQPDSPIARIRTAAPISPTARMPPARAAPSARTSAASIRATPSASMDA